jgi:pimeloyl-ACP methyl ester carboxylesterase
MRRDFLCPRLLNAVGGSGGQRGGALGGAWGIRVYIWEKYAGSPAGKPVVVLAHGSATADRESFDLQVPGKPSYSLMDFLAREGFDVFALDTRGFGRSTHPDTHMTTKEASEDLNAVVDYMLKLRGGQKVSLLGWSWGTHEPARLFSALSKLR